MSPSTDKEQSQRLTAFGLQAGIEMHEQGSTQNTVRRILSAASIAQDFGHQRPQPAYGT